MLEIILNSIVSYISTNMDYILVLVLLIHAHRFKSPILIGDMIGTTILTVTPMTIAILLRAVPETWMLGFLGLFPIYFSLTSFFGKSNNNSLEEADNTVKRICPQAEVIWLVYDKDDFAADSFDNTQYSAENRKSKRKYKVAWSNECLELWFLLHFSDVIPKGGRKDYIQKLESYCHYS